MTEFRRLPRLRRLLDRLDAERAARDIAFLRDPAWEATNNGAERRARQFRHLQAPCFRLRTEAAIENALKVDALRGTPTSRRLSPSRTSRPLPASSVVRGHGARWMRQGGADGSLTAASTTTTGGLGIGSGLGSQGALVLSNDGHLSSP